MQRSRIIALASSAAVLTVAAALLLRRPAPPPALVTTPDGHDGSLTIDRRPAEVFARAFWRRPTSADRIVHAARREWREGGDVRRWQWFLELHPSPALLQALRDPAGFGLVPATSAALPTRADPPTWFPSPAALSGCEILQHPAGGLTVSYRAADNTLFATDTGSGFAPPLVAVAAR